MEFIRSLPLTYGSHIHRHKFLHGRRDLSRTAMPNLLKKASEAFFTLWGFSYPIYP
jgi:hypothetical protein